MEDVVSPSIDFSILFHSWHELALFEGDVFLSMQGMNAGITDAHISVWEASLLEEYIEREKTPIDSAMTVSAFSQQWLFALNEAMRVWRDRIYNLRKWFSPADGSKCPAPTTRRINVGNHVSQIRNCSCQPPNGITPLEFACWPMRHD